MAICISFVVPAFNEEHFIDHCLGAIINESEKAQVTAEIIVVDNGSKDNTSKLARNYTNSVFTIERSSISIARNFGVKQSSHSIIAFIDADVIITSDWFECFVNKYDLFCQQKYLLAGHKYAIRENSSWIEEHWFKNIDKKFLNGGNIIISRQLFEDISGFDPLLKTGEDYDLCKRAINTGCSYYNLPKLKAIHLGYPRNILSFMTRECWHGEGDFLSIENFCKSPVAIIAIIYLISQSSVIILFAIDEFFLSSTILGLILLLNFAITFKRIKKYQIRSFLLNYVINYCYFCARFGSLYRAITNRHLSY